MGGIKSYKVFNQGKWHVVECGPVGDKFGVFVDGQLYSRHFLYETERECIEFLARRARMADEVNSRGAYVRHGVGYKYWNENKPAYKLTDAEYALIRPAPEDFLDGGLYFK